ncbi:type II toxin-antitoxin system ParD family antitoxin [Candidatus Thiodictyon syntrophicum]|uniref:type II toxin-antitoxin system ParD family antitoxin n=1 Tax=Candidatus Thiodictyon syntrophicum TaxID=1166950 RepID=UPI001F02731C|nr:type II toxin-antitoxin system ParD family antitoxin [Candidatus Thiodictyon syntrophicum]
MPTRYVVLTDHQEALVGSLVDSGRYQDAGEVLRERLRLVEQREAEDASRLDALRQAVDSGIRDIDEGRFDRLSTRSQIAADIDEIDTSRATIPASPRKYVYCPRNSLSPEFLGRSARTAAGLGRRGATRTGVRVRSAHFLVAPPRGRHRRHAGAGPGSAAARRPAAGLARRPPRPPDSAANPLARCPERG